MGGFEGRLGGSREAVGGSARGSFESGLGVAVVGGDVSVAAGRGMGDGVAAGRMVGDGHSWAMVGGDFYFFVSVSVVMVRTVVDCCPVDVLFFLRGGRVVSHALLVLGLIGLVWRKLWSDPSSDFRELYVRNCFVFICITSTNDCI